MIDLSEAKIARMILLPKGATPTGELLTCLERNGRIWHLSP